MPSIADKRRADYGNVSNRSLADLERTALAVPANKSLTDARRDAGVREYAAKPSNKSHADLEING